MSFSERGGSPGDGAMKGFGHDTAAGVQPSIARVVTSESATTRNLQPVVSQDRPASDVTQAVVPSNPAEDRTPGAMGSYESAPLTFPKGTAVCVSSGDFDRIIWTGDPSPWVR